MSEAPHSSLDQPLTLSDLAKCISDVQEFTAGMRKDEFLADQRTLQATLMLLTVIGEIVASIPREARERFRDVAWQHMVRLKQKLTCSRHDVDESVVWDTVQRELPPMQSAVNKMLEEQGELVC